MCITKFLCFFWQWFACISFCARKLIFRFLFFVQFRLSEVNSMSTCYTGTVMAVSCILMLPWQYPTRYLDGAFMLHYYLIVLWYYGTLVPPRYLDVTYLDTLLLSSGAVLMLPWQHIASILVRSIFWSYLDIILMLSCWCLDNSTYLAWCCLFCCIDWSSRVRSKRYCIPVPGVCSVGLPNLSKRRVPVMDKRDRYILVVPIESRPCLIGP